MYLSEMTWFEVDKLDRSSVVIAPFGSLEQHSLHLPVFTDSMIGDELSRRLNEKFKDTILILPQMWLGSSSHHMKFPGSMTADFETYIHVARDILLSMLHHGFRKILVLNSHGGNSAVLPVAIQMAKEKYMDATLAFVSYWNVSAKEITAIRESPMGGIGHACEMETSMIMLLRPELVRKDKMEKDGIIPDSEFLLKDMLNMGTVWRYWNAAEHTRHGGCGDPTTASPEKGEKFFAAIADRLAKVVKEIQSGKIT
jgi:creatinine amidohydrolase